jgi:phosphoserine phosphatase RsbU/P
MNIDNTVTILIVDDDLMSVMILENMLKHEGFKTLSTLSGSFAIPIAERKQPDLILLDLNLPGERGTDICRKLKSTPMTSEIPVLFLSADSTVSSKIECFDAGGLDYITKPFELREVLARVNTHLRLQQTQKALTKLLSSKISEISQAQQALLPSKPSEIPDAKFAVVYQQLTDAGGDFYDVIKTGEGIYDYITADVCGHDHSIAFVTAALKTLFIQNIGPQIDPADVLNIVNKVLPSILKSGQFVGVSWVRVNRMTNKALIVNAGQPPVVYISRNGEIKTINVTGDIVGIFKNVVFEQIEIGVEAGDRFILCSDGIVEADGKNSEARTNGIKKLLNVCHENHYKDLTKLVQGLMPLLIGNNEISDDVVILGVEV